jgi:uncharacterized membrane protein YozB (DUF420 family)
MRLIGGQRSEGTMSQAIARRNSVSAERFFFSAMGLLLLATVLVGFARTFFLKPFFPEFQRMAPPEPFFLVHGVFFAAWFVLLAVQPLLVAGGNRALHRRLGAWGVALAVVMIGLGIVGALIAARRPGGFIGVPLPPLQFLIVPFTAVLLFGVFVALAVARRGDSQAHKRLMLLASISLAEAAVARLPFDFLAAASPVPHFQAMELLTLALLLPMVAWDLVSRGRLHAVTLWGGLVLVAAMPLRAAVGATDGWLALARWAVGLLD